MTFEHHVIALSVEKKRLLAEIHKIDQAVHALTNGHIAADHAEGGRAIAVAKKSPGPTPKKKSSGISAAGRAAISEAAKRRWRKIHREKKKAPKAVPLAVEPSPLVEEVPMTPPSLPTETSYAVEG